MIVVGGEECLDRHQPVGPGRFSITTGFPQRGRQPIRKQPRADIHAGAGTERHEEFDRPLRPACVSACACGASNATIPKKVMINARSFDMFMNILTARKA
jgi:hypothetical protein